MNDIQLVCLLAPPLIMLIVLSAMYLFSCNKEENEEEDKRIKESKMKETVKKETNMLDKKLELLALLNKVIIEKNNVIEKNDGGVYVIRCKYYDETNYKPLFVLIKPKDNKVIYGMDDLYDNPTMREEIDLSQLRTLENVVKQLLED